MLEIFLCSIVNKLCEFIRLIIFTSIISHNIRNCRWTFVKWVESVQESYFKDYQNVLHTSFDPHNITN